MKKIIVSILSLISITLLLLNRYTDLYINNSMLHFVILCIATITFVLILAQALGKLKSKRSQLLTLFIVVALCSIHAFLNWGGDWKTQKILYQNTEKTNKTIDFQLRGDRFAFGYKKRIICRNRILPGFDWTTDIDTTKINHNQWKKLDLFINEMKLTKQGS
jgi:hypothetical protein